MGMKEIYGDEEAQYDLLLDYADEIRRRNHGSSFFVAIDENLRFRRAYMCLEASRRGFLQGCRPVIFVDGTFIKTRYKGQLLTAVGMDPNDCIFPIAVATVEVEDTASWTWFLETLKNDLGIANTEPWTIMSDKQKGLINAVKAVFPESEHRFCVRHMWQNFQQKFRGDALKNQLWRIARSSAVARFEANMAYMKLLNHDAWAWLEELDHLVGATYLDKVS
jgi:transposase-like protein